MNYPTTTGMRSLEFIAGALLGLSMLLLLRQYPGIAHDSMLYLGQGLAHRWPDVFNQDLFFVHGSQGQYSVMPWMLGKLFLFAKPPPLFLWGTLSSLMLFAACSWIALRDLLPRKQRYWAWLGIICLPSMYGVINIFSYNEPFLTSRPFSEAFCLLAIGMLARRRWWLFTVTIVIAGLLHPLQAIGAMLIIWPWAVMQDRRWLHLAWLTAPIILLALFGVSPFDGLIQSAELTWLVELKRSHQLFMTLWSVNDFKVLFFDAMVLGFAWHCIKDRFGTWCLAALIGLATGTLLSLVLVDVLHLILPSGLQLWRSHWMAHWFSMAAIAALLFKHIRDRQHVLWLLLSLTALLAWGETAWAWLLLASMYLTWPLLPADSRMRLERPLTWIFGLAIVLLFANHATNELHWFIEAGYRLDVYPVDRRLLAFPALCLGLPLFGWYVWERASLNGRRLIICLFLCPLAILSAYRWDIRHPVQRVAEDAAFSPNIFGVEIPKRAQVFWAPEWLVANWMVLGRASYFSESQLAGQMFNRATLEDGRQRGDRMQPLLRDILDCQQEEQQGANMGTCRISIESMLRACDPSLGLAPDYLVLPYAQTQKSVGSWTIADPKTHTPVLIYRLYSCSDVIGRLAKNSAVHESGKR